MTCVCCGSWCAPSDNYCRHCGDKLQAVMPAAAVRRALAVLPASVAPTVVKTVAAVVAGKALEWAVRRAARGLAANAGAAIRGLVPGNGPANVTKSVATPVLPAAGVLISEAVILWREVRRLDDGGTPSQHRR